MHELCAGMDEEPAESPWVTTSGQTNMVDDVGVYYRPPDQEKEIDNWLLQIIGRSLTFTGPGPHVGIQPA